MRILFLPLLAAAATLVSAQQPSTAPVNVAGNLSIPAQLNTTIKADKAHAGDVVHFKTVEAVLVSKGLVMPANTRLYGRVLGAAPRQGQTPSWISVVVDRAEWKEHTLPLHAFIFGRISSLVPIETGVDPSIQNPNLSSTPGQSSAGKRYNLGNPQDAVAMGRAADVAAWANEANMQAPFLADVKLARQKSGATFLFAERHNLKLPGGILFLLQNVPALSSPQEKPAISVSK